LFFYDDTANKKPSNFYGFSILENEAQAISLFASNNQFMLALGGSKNRYLVYNKLTKIGGDVQSIIAPTSIIGQYNVQLGQGLNIMHGAFISSEVSIGKGSLINVYSAIHHDVQVGQFCEISPRATLLGGCVIGDFSTIGSAATILPDIIIGQNVVVGAGAVVTKNIPDNSVVVGVPGKVIKKLNQ
jgi:sugar O-acyltransferase (sialic acid O-acetyltransferase NeuD family)